MTEPTTRVGTGEFPDKEETWLLESSEREKRLCREMVYIKNLRLTPQNKALVEEFHYYWQRAKALRKWLFSRR